MGWRVIRRDAGGTLYICEHKKLSFQREGKQSFHTRFEFTRSISLEAFEEGKLIKPLKDDGERIYKCEIDEDDSEDNYEDSSLSCLKHCFHQFFFNAP